MTKVVIGLSGGVDSSVAAAILKERGYEVIGLFMRNWQEENNGVCSAEADYNDVRRVADTLDIPYYSIDFSKEYYNNVFEEFLAEYKAGRTPNPDILCNREIKFGPFREFAEKLGAEYIATGHYCGTEIIDGKTFLTRAVDENKDQTYFLSAVREEQLKNVVFPLSDITKPRVREIAQKLNLANAKKKDSTGVCFIGERDFRKFLKEYIPSQKGEIKTLDGKVVGTHEGVCYYTVGQRKGFGLGGGGNGQPWYVVDRDVKTNTLYVNQGECPLLYSSSLTTDGFNWITEKAKDGQKVLARIRHRQPLQKATITYEDNGIKVDFEEPQRAIASGQYCVIYDGKYCLGGGKIK